MPTSPFLAIVERVILTTSFCVPEPLLMLSPLAALSEITLSTISTLIGPLLLSARMPPPMSLVIVT